MGSVVISIDAELAWGFHDLPDPPEPRIRRARSAWVETVDLFDEYLIPATWAVVGHLLLEECNGEHADHPAATSGWFDADPGGDGTENDLWFGTNLVDAIREADADHEVGSHSFSHVIFDRDRITPEIAAAEFRRSAAVARERDLSVSSFVFPRNIVGFRELLPKYGFEAYRGRAPPRWYDDSKLYPLAKFVSYTVGTEGPPLVKPEIDEHGLVNIPASLDLYSFEGPARTAARPFGEDPIVRQAKMGIDAAAESPGVFHIWLHPNNLVDQADVDRLRRVLSYVAERRDEGRLSVETMADVAERTLAKHRDLHA
ncbi:polysaccharide deacetylase family protein [Natronolimnohabitans sp. A-GB9]|uniref:polysaccharide deacetylase family protein n=1 Tax=Natronolimnohabitans sp. A-GB9 TaxID=3069757 RepID=UPI0027B4A443|nr:polysaccharide deacetylase family protein [Natronolimnohabitans sp. A-GB9]MDQ2052035.1 polysaccharide deacetylase family protein [Natronolimnohabitans sp. A-GB9]